MSHSTYLESIYLHKYLQSTPLGCMRLCTSAATHLPFSFLHFRPRHLEEWFSDSVVT